MPTIISSGSGRPLTVDRVRSFQRAQFSALATENEGAVNRETSTVPSANPGILRTIRFTAHVKTAFTHTGDETNVLICEVSTDGGTTFTEVDRVVFRINELAAGDLLLPSTLSPNLDVPASAQVRIRTSVLGDASGAGEIQLSGVALIEVVSAA